MESGMPIWIALAVVIALMVVAIVVRLIWVLFIFVPLYACLALAIYLVLRSRRREAETESFVAREAERQRLLNAQEFKAWKTAADGARRNSAKRDRALRQFDQSRKPPDN